MCSIVPRQHDNWIATWNKYPLYQAHALQLCHLGVNIQSTWQDKRPFETRLAHADCVV